MATRATLTEIKRSVEDSIGKKVILKTNKGKRKVNVKEGVLDETFPCVFTVTVDSGAGTKNTISYSYSDILTETVELTLCSTSELIKQM